MKMNKLLIALVIMLGNISACAVNESPLHYVVETERKFRFNKVLCSYEKALEIAETAAINKFPEYEQKIRSDKDQAFSESHGGNEPETIIREFRLVHRDIDLFKSMSQQYVRQTDDGIQYYHNSYYRESIEVILNNSCEVQDIHFLKGTEYAVY